MRILIFLFLLSATLLNFTSCIEHEVIPPPVNTVKLNASFVGYINGTQIEFNENVDGYKGYASKDPYIYASPVLSKIIYASTMKSTFNSQEITVNFGALDWDGSSNTEPTLTMFNDFHTSNSNKTLPFKDYSSLVNNNVDGIQVKYTDKNGIEWKSKESDPNQSATITVLNQASDNTGDYSLFECKFSCLVWTYDVQLAKDVSKTLNNAVVRAWFKR